MELGQIHEKVDEKLIKLETEIARFKSNIESCDDVEQRTILENDLATLHVIREKLLKAKDLTQQVSDLRSNVENPAQQNSFDSQAIFAKLGVTPLQGMAALGVAILLIGLVLWVF